MIEKLQFSIGPVQAFIEESRQMRDYWSSSFLISWLSSSALHALVSEKPSSNISSLGKMEILPFPGDPMVVAHFWKGANDENGPQPFFGTFSNRFSTSGQSIAEAEFLLSHTNTQWRTLGDAVWKLIFEDNELESFDLSEVRGIWDNQVGIKDQALNPFLQILVANKLNNVDFEAFKGQRLGMDFSKYKGWNDERGLFCSLISGFRELSPAAGKTKKDNQIRKVFWGLVRNRLIDLRYKEKAESFKGELRPIITNIDDKNLKFSDFKFEIKSRQSCLDLKDNEILSAPALIRRVFPLLGLSNLGNKVVKDVIGWVPRFPSANSENIVPSTWKTKIRRIFPSNLSGNKDAVDQPRDEGEGEIRELPFWPSVTQIAAASWIERAKETKPDIDWKVASSSLPLKFVRKNTQPWFINTRHALDLFSIDANLFQDGARRRFFSGDGIEAPTEFFDAVQDLVGAAVIGVPREKLGRPPQYYAILRMDGDDVGQLMNGANPENTSQDLNNFAAELRGKFDSEAGSLGLVYRHNALLVFLGGDDFMAFMPVEEALPLAIATRKKYSATGLSGALTFVHVRTPLRLAIDITTQLLNELAKSAPKDKLSIGIIGLSGDIGRHGKRHSIELPWRLNGDDISNGPVQRLDYLVKKIILHAPDIASNQVYHNIVDRLRPYLNESSADIGVNQFSSLLTTMIADILTTVDGIDKAGGSKEIAEELVFLASGFARVENRYEVLNFPSKFNHILLEILRLLRANWLVAMEDETEQIP